MPLWCFPRDSNVFSGFLLCIVYLLIALIQRGKIYTKTLPKIHTCFLSRFFSSLQLSKMASLKTVLKLVFKLQFWYLVSKFVSIRTCDGQSQNGVLGSFIAQVNSNLEMAVISDEAGAIHEDRSIAGLQWALFRTSETAQILQVANRKGKILYITQFHDVNSTVDFISEFGTQIASKYAGYTTWRMVVLWPDPVPPSERRAVLESTLGQVANMTWKYKISAEFFITFSNAGLVNSSSSTSSSTSEEGEGETIGGEAKFGFYEVYGIVDHLVIKEVGDLGNIMPHCADLCSPWTGRRLDFGGALLRVGGIDDIESANDTEYIRDPGTNQLKLTSGFSVDQFHIMQQALNFTYSAEIWTSAMAKEAGEISAWDGIILGTENGNIDFGVSASVYLPSRLKRVSFLPPSDEYVVSAFFRPPSSAALRDIFTQPFKLDLWAAVVITWLLLSFSMIFFSAVRRRLGAGDEDEPDFTQNSLIWAVATACQQGWDEHPVSTSMRVIFIAGSFSAVISYAGYSAAIVSTLSLKIEVIKTPDDLITHNIPVGMRVGYLDLYLVNTTTNDAVTRIYSYLEKSKQSGKVDTVTGVNLVLNSKKPYAFICVRDAFYDVVKKNISDDGEICGIRDLPVLQQKLPVGPFTAKESPYKQFFRVILLRTRERGVLWRLKNYYLYTRRCLLTDDSSQSQKLSFLDVFTAFVVLLVGYVLSGFFLFLEILWFRKTLIYLI